MQKWPESDVVIRICFRRDHQVDWHVSSPNNITFQDVLDAICQASDDEVAVTSFEYEDEDGDRITVKTDDELQAMLSFHVNMSCCADANSIITGSFLSKGPQKNIGDYVGLSIYPKIARPSRRRNVHDLKVAIAPTASSLLLAKTGSKGETPPTSRKPFVNGLYGEQQFQHIQGSTPIGCTEVQQHIHALSTESEKKINLINTDGVSAIRKSLSFELGNISNDTLIFLETLGTGNSGVVRKAIHTESQTVTAVKSITVDLTGEEQRRILLELEILRRCNGSPYIIAFYGAYFDENRILLCTEYMDGGSLDRYGKIPDPLLQSVACAIAFGLRHLWSLRIMHRDVKPSNILVNTNGCIKLCDFGVSTQLVDSIARTYVGTNAYMAPERVIGRDYTIYSDVWSFGLSLCELAIGEFPYPQLAAKIAGSRGVVPMEVMQCIVNEDAPRLPVGQFPTELSDFINCCLQKEATNRLLPEQLCVHRLIISKTSLSDVENLGLVSNWIRSKLFTMSENNTGF